MNRLSDNPTDEQIDSAFDDYKNRFSDDALGIYGTDLERAEALCPADLIEENLRCQSL